MNLSEITQSNIIICDFFQHPPPILVCYYNWIGGFYVDKFQYFK